MRKSECIAVLYSNQNTAIDTSSTYDRADMVLQLITEYPEIIVNYNAVPVHQSQRKVHP
ncbi:MAG: hypothetical protein WD049_00300 [Candidatus Paceibacterota bacterium]